MKKRIISIIIMAVMLMPVATVPAHGQRLVKAVAHRGYGYHARENTAKAFRLAGKHHFWATECDIYETKHTKNGSFRLALHHDDTFQRVYGRNIRVRSMTASQMKKTFPDITFLETFADICVKYNMVPIVELKDQSMSDAAIHKAVDIMYNRGLLETTFFQSYSMKNLRKVRKYIRKEYHQEPALIYLLKGSKSSVRRGIRRAHKNKIDRVSIKKTRIDRSIYRYCKKHKMKISAWTFYQNQGKSNFRSDKRLLQKLVKRYHIEMIAVQCKEPGSFL